MWGGAFRSLILGLLFGVAAAALYAHHDSNEEEIRRIRMVRGEIPGALFTEAKIVSLTSRRGNPAGRSYFVRFEIEGDVHERKLPRVAWSQLKEGGLLKVAELANDPKIYLPGGVWASDENLDYERAIRTVKRIGIGFFALLGLVCVVRAFFMKPTPG